MPDLFTMTDTAAATVQTQLADMLEQRGNDPQQQAMRTDYLSRIPFPAEARVLEVGCGTGVVTRVLARRPRVARVTGVDLSPFLLARARQLAAHLQNVTFQAGDGRSLPFAAETFNVVVFHTTLSHVPEPQQALREVFRLLVPSGSLAVFDGDYASVTVARSVADPLQTCIQAWQEAFVHNLWLMRHLPALVTAVGFEGVEMQNYSYVQTREPAYLLHVISRGADALLASGCIGDGLAAALKHEAHGRVQRGEFFGRIPYTSLIAHKPARSEDL